MCQTINSEYIAAYPYSIVNITNDRISYDDNAYGLYNIGCTPGTTYFDTYGGTCTYSQTHSTGCNNYGGPAIITCVYGRCTNTCTCVYSKCTIACTYVYGKCTIKCVYDKCTITCTCVYIKW